MAHVCDAVFVWSVCELVKAVLCPGIKLAGLNSPLCSHPVGMQGSDRLIEMW